MSDIEQIISGLTGYVDTYHWPDELRMMSRIASEITIGNIVAIGSYRGQMDCALALNAQVPVWCIDPRDPDPTHTHYGPVDLPYWMQNVLAMNVANKVRPIALPSNMAAKAWSDFYGPDSKISLLFIDGNHDGASADLQAWWPYVPHDGLVAMHDSDFPSVQEAVAWPIASRMMVEMERADKTIVYLKKVG
jgi:hypothetical protein